MHFPVHHELLSYYNPVLFQAIGSIREQCSVLLGNRFFRDRLMEPQWPGLEGVGSNSFWNAE